jgi:hypothetical protein
VSEPPLCPAPLRSRVASAYPSALCTPDHTPRCPRAPSSYPTHTPAPCAPILVPYATVRHAAMPRALHSNLVIDLALLTHILASRSASAGPQQRKRRHRLLRYRRARRLASPTYKTHSMHALSFAFAHYSSACAPTTVKPQTQQASGGSHATGRQRVGGGGRATRSSINKSHSKDTNPNPEASGSRGKRQAEPPYPSMP